MTFPSLKWNTTWVLVENHFPGRTPVLFLHLPALTAFWQKV